MIENIARLVNHDAAVVSAAGATRRILKVVPVVLAMVSGQASAQTILNLQSIPVFFTCLAQEPAAVDDYWNSAPTPQSEEDAQWLEEEKDRIRAWVTDSPWAECARRKKWISQDYCRDIIAGWKTGRHETARAMEKHRNEFMNLRVMFEYFEESSKAAKAGAVAPACPAD